MSYEITISDDARYIIGKIDGPLTQEVAMELAREYLKIINSTGIKLILNDVRGTRDKMKILEAYNFANKDIDTIGFPRGVRAVILADENDKSHEFQETVANNAGYFVRVFYSYDQAIEWLLP